MAEKCKKGKLSKYTNVMKGWQHRYFVLNPATGILEYHISQSESSNYPNKPRGFLQLEGAVIAPSTEDSSTFTVNASNGEVYKLRATNAKERQDWVSTLRSVSDYCIRQVAEDHPPLSSSSSRKPKTKSLVSNINTNLNKLKDTKCRPRTESHSSVSRILSEVKNLPKPDDRSELKEPWQALTSVNNYLAGLTSQLDNLPFKPTSGETHLSTDKTLSCVDKEVLLMKCTSSAMLQSLTTAYSELHLFKQQSDCLLPPGAQISWMSKNNVSNSNSSVSPTIPNKNEQQTCLVVVPMLADPKEEVKDEDNVSIEEDFSDSIGKNKNIVLHLISQLKLGMDLTKVTLPTFILEPRSLLEMYADFNSSTQLLLDVTFGSFPLQRMNRILKFYLTSFYIGRKGNHAKKPFNPVISELFQCSFYVDKSLYNKEHLPSNESYRVRFLAEQVSHHPPVSAMYLSCKELKMSMTSHIWTKSRFMNMTVGVSNVGEGTLLLGEHDEEYVITYPSAYARSLLSEPWSELTGRCTIECKKSNLIASIVFHTKPAYAGEPHKVSAEVKNMSNGDVLTKVVGKWNDKLYFTYVENDEEEVVDIKKLPVLPKFVRPIDKQNELESRKFWLKVSDAMKRGDIDEASEHKKKLEEDQREIVKQRTRDGVTVTSAYFSTIKIPDKHNSYIYKGPL